MCQGRTKCVTRCTRPPDRAKSFFEALWSKGKGKSGAVKTRVNARRGVGAAPRARGLRASRSPPLHSPVKGSQNPGRLSTPRQSASKRGGAWPRGPWGATSACQCVTKSVSQRTPLGAAPIAPYYPPPQHLHVRVSSVQRPAAMRETRNGESEVYKCMCPNAHLSSPHS